MLLSVFTRFEKFNPVDLKWIKKSFLSEEYKEKYKILLEEWYLLLFKK